MAPDFNFDLLNIRPKKSQAKILFGAKDLSATIFGGAYWPNDGMQVFGTSVLASFWRFGLPAKF